MLRAAEHCIGNATLSTRSPQLPALPRLHADGAFGVAQQMFRALVAALLRSLAPHMLGSLWSGLECSDALAVAEHDDAAEDDDDEQEGGNRDALAATAAPNTVTAAT